MSKELVEYLWDEYQLAQISADHTQRECFIDVIAAALAAQQEPSASQPDTVAVPRECDHDWRIWPETDGYEQRCSKCKAYRNTPQEVRDAVIRAAQEKGREG